MWFLEIYYVDGADSMRSYNTYTMMKYAQRVLSQMSGSSGDIVKFVSYYSDGQSTSNEVTTYP